MPERLMLGSIDVASPPITGSGALYRLSTSYGASVGADVPMLVETSEVALAGPVGQSLYRRVLVPIDYDAACTVTVTPIVDYNQSLTATSKSFAGPTTRQQVIISAMLSKVGSVLRVRVAIASRAGAVSVRTPSVEGKPMTATAPSPAVGT